MKKKLYIGFAISIHDPSIAIVNEEGKVLFAEATERHLQNKRAFNCLSDDINFIDKLLKPYSKVYDQYVLAYSWDNKWLDRFPKFWKLSEKRDLKVNKFSYEPTTFKGAYANYIMVGENLRFRLVSMNPDAQITKRYYYHHDTHMKAACHGSPFNEAVCAVVDGSGEKSSTKYFIYRNNQTREIKNIPISLASLGNFYSELCSFCGFDGIKGEEWKVMGLAPYGKFDPDLHALLNQLIYIDGCTLKFRPKNYLALEKLYRIARKPDEPSLSSANLAYTGQEFFSDIMTQLLTNLHSIGGSDNLILTGGCALNSSFNGKIIGRTPFKNLYIPSAPADDGNSIGAALMAFYEDHPDYRPPEQILSPYLGHEAKQEKLEQAVELGGMKNSLKPGEDLYKKTAKLLAEGKIIGWFQGRAEMGPRALGNRSILADPRSADVKERINARVKFREEYRPFAPSILHEFGPEYFENYQESPYMERTLKFKKEVYQKVPGVVHVDGTGRLQTVKKDWNEKFHLLISEFHKITGVPILLNTSFNVMGKPIVHSVEDAFAVYCTSGLDALVIEDKLFIK